MNFIFSSPPLAPLVCSRGAFFYKNSTSNLFQFNQAAWNKIKPQPSILIECISIGDINDTSNYS